MSDTSNEKGLRRIRSFVRRQGRITPGQAKALHDYWDEYGLNVADGLLDMTTVFPSQAPVILEIGFGNGESLLQMAEQAPDQNFVGIEVHEPGVGALVNNAKGLGLANLKAYGEDAIDVLNQCIPDNSLQGVQLYFPDPWHKKRHHKRRIVQPEFVALIASKLVQGGYFHMATDWENYAEHMMDVMSQSKAFSNNAGVGAFSEKPSFRPETKFERRGLRLGHGVWDLVFTKR